MSEDARSFQNPSDAAAGGGSEQAGAATPGAAGATGAAPPVRQWYYSVGGQPYGPVTEGELAALARAGYFKKDDYVYAAYIGGWVRADSVHGLFDEVGVAAGAGPGGPGAGPIYVPGPSAPLGQVAYAEYAGFWIRFVAIIVDGLVLALPGCMISGVMQGVLGAAMAAAGPLNPLQSWTILPPLFGAMGIAFLAQLIIPWLYFGLMESSAWQATLGKRAVGIMVCDAEGRRISFGRASGRYFASIISGLILYIGYIIGAFTDRKQTLHDMIANTVVIQGRTS